MNIRYNGIYIRIQVLFDPRQRISGYFSIAGNGDKSPLRQLVRIMVIALANGNIDLLPKSVFYS